MKPYLRHYFAAAFILAATVPVLILGVWLERAATERAMSSVSEKHLLLAKSLKQALQRYATDLRATFHMFVRTAVTGDGTALYGDLAQRLHIRSFAIFVTCRCWCLHWVSRNSHPLGTWKYRFGALVPRRSIRESNRRWAFL